MKRKNIFISLTVAVCLIVVLVILKVTATTPTESLYKSTNKPEFYGLTKAIIHKGDSFSLTDPRFRIYAKDFEDGDLTNKVAITSNVNPNLAGKYKIHYEIIDSDHNKAELDVPIEVVDTPENRYYERTMYSLPSVWNMSLAGTNRGNNDDRQILGFYMEANSQIFVNKVSGEKNLTLTYLNNDSAKEKSFTITNEKTLVTSDYSGVPFIKTLYETSEPVVVGIEVADETKVKELPYYYYKDNEEKFFAYWDSIPDSFAVIDNQSTMTLLPYQDRQKLVNYYNKCHHSLDEYLEYWDVVTQEYDDFLGLEYDPEDPIDQNVKTKYFFKANKHGAGAAYYAGDHVGVNSESAASLFEQNWGGLHEVGHGYQGSLGSTGMGLGEVSNNILGHYIQINKYQKIYDYNDDWLGKIPAIEKSFNAKRLAGTTFNNLELNERLYVLINLLDTYDPKKTYAEINKIWRRAKQEGNNITNQDAYVLAYAKLYNVNVIPYFESWGLEISENLKKDLVNLPILSSMGDLITDDANLAHAQSELQKEGIFSLVTNQEVASLGLTSKATYQIQIDNLEELKGKKIIITNNQNYKKEVEIQSETITIDNVPVGMYEIILPVPKNNVYNYNKYNYIAIKEGEESTYTFVYTNTSNNVSEFLALDQYIEFRGLGDSLFAKVTFDEKNINISYNGQPHVYFPKQVYASLKILNPNNTVVWEKAFMGDESYKSNSETIPYQYGYKLVINHLEINRLKIKSTFLNKEDTYLTKVANQDNVYIIGKYGLYQTTEADSYNHYKEKIDDYAAFLKENLSENELLNKEVESQKKRVLNNSILYLEDKDKQTYKEKYLNLYNGSKPELNNQEITFYQNETINLFALLKGKDLEDGIFNLNERNFSYSAIPLDKSAKPMIGNHNISYELKDSDDNKITGTLVVIIKEPLNNNSNNNGNVNSNSNNTNQNQNNNNIPSNNHSSNQNTNSNTNNNNNNNTNNNTNSNYIPPKEENSNQESSNNNEETITPNKNNKEEVKTEDKTSNQDQFDIVEKTNYKPILLLIIISIIGIAIYYFRKTTKK